MWPRLYLGVFFIFTFYDENVELVLDFTRITDRLLDQLKLRHVIFISLCDETPN